MESIKDKVKRRVADFLNELEGEVGTLPKFAHNLKDDNEKTIGSEIQKFEDKYEDFDSESTDKPLKNKIIQTENLYDIEEYTPRTTSKKEENWTDKFNKSRRPR
mgnify:CR=1 FL=1